MGLYLGFRLVSRGYVIVGISVVDREVGDMGVFRRVLVLIDILS